MGEVIGMKSYNKKPGDQFRNKYKVEGNRGEKDKPDDEDLMAKYSDREKYLRPTYRAPRGTRKNAKKKCLSTKFRNRAAIILSGIIATGVISFAGTGIVKNIENDRVNPKITSIEQIEDNKELLNELGLDDGMILEIAAIKNEIKQSSDNVSQSQLSELGNRIRRLQDNVMKTKVANELGMENEDNILLKDNYGKSANGAITEYISINGENKDVSNDISFYINQIDRMKKTLDNIDGHSEKNIIKAYREVMGKIEDFAIKEVIVEGNKITTDTLRKSDVKPTKEEDEER